MSWLRTRDDTALLATPLVLGSGVVLEHTAVPGEHGWRPGLPVLPALRGLVRHGLLLTAGPGS